MNDGPEPTFSVADVVGETLAACGVTDAFGVVGSGNFVVTNALIRSGARFHHARHEGPALSMADGYARCTGAVGVCSVHQGPGLTNTLTGLTEAVKSRSPVLVLAGETPASALNSNFRIDQHGLVESVGAIAERLHSAASAADDVRRAYHRAQLERGPVVLMLPIDIQAQPGLQAALAPTPAPVANPAPPEPGANAITAITELIEAAERPAIIAGRGAVLSGAGHSLEVLGALSGAVLATSAPANGLFAGLPFALGIAGGFATPLAAELLSTADLVLAFGASLNNWTTKHGTLLNPGARLVHVDVESRAFGRHRAVDLAVLADAGATATALAAELQRRAHHHEGFRTAATRQSIAERSWHHEPYDDAGTSRFIDPRTLSIELDRLLPRARTVAVDSGAFLGYPSMFLGVPDARAWLFPNGFQAVGLGLGNAIGAAVAFPERTTVAAIGDGGAYMALAELETAARLGLGNLLVVIYDDSAYGAEVHHFAPVGHDVSVVQFADSDLAEIARAAGTRAKTVRRVEDLGVVDEWLSDSLGTPLVLDAKVNPEICAEWLEEAFRSG